jgi:hypothetical protein
VQNNSLKHYPPKKLKSAAKERVINKILLAKQVPAIYAGVYRLGFVPGGRE